MSSTIRIEEEDRFSRFRRIQWWDQEKLAAAKVLVVGAGALGNEVIKNLALLGVGHLVIVDRDTIEQSNLCRSVLFRETDQGQAKASIAARTARQIYPGLDVTPLVGDLTSSVGLGWFRWADVVVGALDNREARVQVNAFCAQSGTPWFDGGIEVLTGVVRGFAPPQTACYECTMGSKDWEILNQRRSCSLLARQSFEHGGTPTTPTTASIIGAMQAQEVVKYLHGHETFSGSGYVLDGHTHQSYLVEYPVNPECPWHQSPGEIHPEMDLTSDSPLQSVWNAAAQRLGSVDAIDFVREIVTQLCCDQCETARPVFQSIEAISPAQVTCPQCGNECRPELLHSITSDSDHLQRTAKELGLPRFDVVWARKDEVFMGFEFSGDQPGEQSQQQNSTRSTGGSS